MYYSVGELIEISFIFMVNVFVINVSVLKKYYGSVNDFGFWFLWYECVVKVDLKFCLVVICILENILYIWIVY